MQNVAGGLYKTLTFFIYTSKLFDFKLSEFFILFGQKNNLDLNENMIKVFDHFIDGLDLFFDMLDISSTEDCQIKIFGFIILKNKNILHTTNKFHNWPWFSNIAIAMDNKELFKYQSDGGTCYAQVYANYNNYNITLNDCPNKYRR
jgi:hypothetical protein